MLSLLQGLFERFPIRNDDRFSLQRFLPRSTPLFGDRISHLHDLLETHDETSDELSSTLKELETFYPRPPVQIIPKGAWPKEFTISSYRLSVQTHLKSTFSDAVNRLKATGRTLSPEDEKYLHLLLTHTCGWSATYPEQMNAPWWADFFPVSYRQLKGLVPILDSMTYLEELVDFPDEYHFQTPQFFLLATPDCYFVYDATDGVAEGLFIAGETLEEVYHGLKDWRWAESSEDPWDFVEEGELGYGRPSFPIYYRKKNGNFGNWDIGGTHEEYPGKARPGLLQSLCDVVFGNPKQ
jgi:hypothetical protein